MYIHFQDTCMDKLGSNFIQRLALISLIGPISLETACSREGGRDGRGGGGRVRTTTYSAVRDKIG